MARYQIRGRGWVAGILAIPLMVGCGSQLARMETKLDDVGVRTRGLERDQKIASAELTDIRQRLESEGLTSNEERADLLSRIASMERVIRQLDARVEEQEALLSRIYAAVDVLSKRPLNGPAATMRLGEEDGAAPTGSADTGDALTADPSAGGAVETEGLVDPPPVGGEGVVATPPASSSPGAEVYDAAFKDYTRGSYSLARDGFTEFLSRYPETPLADNASYWIGETWYAQGNYQEAIAQFESVLRRYPDGDILAAAMLKAANCHLELADEDRAIEVYRELLREYPESDEAFIARHKLAEIGVSP